MKKQNNTKGVWIQTYTKKKFYPLNPRCEDIDIEDIAWSLSNLCRYNGHCKFYSVAEHSIYASQYLPSKYALEGLMHDAAEAYIGDISTPVKQLLPDIKKIEHVMLKCIAEKFKLEYPFREAIKKVDLRLLATEASQIMNPQVEVWPQLTEPPFDFKIKCVRPANAFNIFMRRYETLRRL